MITKQLYYSYRNGKNVINGVDFEILPGMNVIIGPNASGKSTLLKCLAGILKTKSSVFFEGREISGCRNLYQMASYLPQQISVNAALSVFEIMLLGQMDRLSWRVGDERLEMARAALDAFGIGNLASKRIDEISGGQQQEVFIAQSLMKKPKYLLLDEPTNNLDLKNQFEIMEKIKTYTRKEKAHTLIILHDLNLALRYADRLCVMKNGKIGAAGVPDEVVSEKMIEEIYNIKAEVIRDGDGICYIVPKTALEV